MITTYYQTPNLDWLKLTLNDTHQVTTAIFSDTAGKNRTMPATLKRALDTYFKTGTNLPKHLYQFPAGTDFQQAVWRAIATIPAGQTITYTELAKKVKRPAAVRATGSACGKNPLALFIPCHRVVRSSGENYTYAWGTDRKRALLTHEGVLS